MFEGSVEIKHAVPQLPPTLDCYVWQNCWGPKHQQIFVKKEVIDHKDGQKIVLRGYDIYFMKMSLIEDGQREKILCENNIWNPETSLTSNCLDECCGLLKINSQHVSLPRPQT